ncbi:MAG TPA: hypothetical protein VHA33_20360 [Candidatus Angelobacter sp.]|jgi:hypothetical protein|nr:hypothetical protein [Candidatus Angelobacter sp.]
MNKLRVAVSVIVLCPFLFAQQPAQQEQQVQQVAESKSAGKDVETKAAPKISARDRELALQMLEISDSEARGFEAPMRSYSLLQIAQIFVPINPEKARGLLGDAFTASLGIQDDDNTKGMLQEEILKTLLPLSQADVEERLPQAELSVRKQVADTIVRKYAEKKQFEPAMELINQVTGWDEFPYLSGTQLMLAMPSEMSAEKLGLFTQAVNSYKNHEHGKRIMMGDGSLTNLVVRFGSKMPAKVVLEAIDEILSQAKKGDASHNITVGSSAGTASFSSIYDYQLFALLPALELLDEGRAESLLKENQQLKTQLQQFPDGMRSIDSNLTDAPPQKGKGGVSISVNRNGTSAGASRDYMRQEYQRQALDIAAESAKNPTQAIARTTTLPVKLDGAPMSPRAYALEEIAKVNSQGNPGAAKQALDELRKIVPDLVPRNQIEVLSTAARIYLKIGEKESAQAVVLEGFKAAEKMLAKDTDANDPNKALKAWWPSADAYRRFVEVQTNISPRSAAKVLKEIGDPEIRTSASITVSRSLLDLPTKRFVVAEKRKNQNSTSISEED